MNGIKILGTGRCIPRKVVTNADLTRIVDTDEEWIRSRTGIERRHHLTTETHTDLCVASARQALENAGIRPDEIGACIVATLTADSLVPSAACRLQRELGLPGDSVCFDLNAACTGFLFALHTMGAVTPIGHTAPESWNAVRSGACGVAPITAYDTAGLKVTLAAEVKDYRAEDFFDKREAKTLARFTQFALIAAREALADAGFSLEQADPDRCGVIVSSGIGALNVTEEEHSRGLAKGFDRVSPFYIPMKILSIII